MLAAGSRGSAVDPEVAMASRWKLVTRKSKEVSRWRMSRPWGRWGVVWIRAAERGGGACNRNPGLESDKLGRVTEWQSRGSGTLQDLRFWKTRRAGTRKSRSVGFGKDGMDGEQVEWASKVGGSLW